MKYIPIPDKYTNAQSLNNKGGYFNVQTHSNSERIFDDTQSSTSLKYSVSAYTKSFEDSIHFSVLSSTGSTSAYWNHAISYLMSYNTKYKFFDIYSLSGLSSIVVFNIGRRDFGDRIKRGSLKIGINSKNYFSQRYNAGLSSQDLVADVNHDGIVNLSDSAAIVAATSSTSLIYSISALNNYTADSITGAKNVFYFYPFFNESNETIAASREGLWSNSFIGKMWPYNGFGILYDDFYTPWHAQKFVDSITSVEWKSDIMMTEMHVFSIKDPYEYNYTSNPSILKPLNSGTGSLSGYSYGRDGLTGASSEMIDTISAINTYVTTIAYYNDNNECLAVSKLPQPIKLIKELPYSFKSVIDFQIR